MRAPWPSPVTADASDVKPLGDFVLVKQLDLREQPGLWTPNEKQEVRRGLVMCTGPGDKLLTLQCLACGVMRTRVANLEWLHSDHLRGPVELGSCECGATQVRLLSESRTPMHVQPGDEILYWRAPANDVTIKGESYVFLHEQQHVVAVIEGV